MWLLIDLSYLAHRSRFALKDFAYEDIPTGILYGFFEQLYAICSNHRFKTSRIAIFSDSRFSIRTKQFPDYKRKRKESRSEEELEALKIMYEQVDLLKDKILPAMGIPVYGQKGLESDDLMAWVAGELTRKGERGVMITGDGDLYQCISPFVGWYDPGRNLYFSKTSFRRAKGVNPSKWGLVKAIGGCTSDGVPGVRGVSEAGALSYILHRIPPHHKKYELIKNAFKSGEIKKWKRIVVLPHKKTKPFTFSSPKYDSESFFKFCKKYGIESYLIPSEKRKWVNFFKGIL